MSVSQHVQQDYSIHGLSLRLGSWLANSTDQPEKRAIYAYGAEVAIGAIVKVIVAGILSLALGIVPIIVVLVLSTAVLRLIAGGAHCTAYYRCLIYSIITFFGLGLLLKISLPYLIGLSRGAIVIPLLVCLILNLRWAPSPSENRPLRDDAEKRSKRLLAVLMCLVLSIVLLLAGTNRWWVWTALVGMLSEALTITPWGIRFVSGCDRLLAGELWRKEAELNG